jgi:hypothetical protein
MNKVYYWLIDRANASPYLMSLVPYHTIYTSYQPQTPIDPKCSLLNLSEDRMTDIFLDLFRDNYLLGIKLSDLDDIEVTDPNSHDSNIEQMAAKSFMPSRQEIKKALNQEEEASDHLCYFMTLKGGEVWESIFKPKWNQYFKRSSDFNNETDLIYCVDLEIGKKLISVDNLRVLDDERIFQSIPDTETWESITPWQVLYWKTLPVGYLISYKSKYVEKENIKKSKGLRKKIRKADEWLINTCKWYEIEYFNEWLMGCEKT